MNATYHEINTQLDAWKDAINAVLQNQDTIKNLPDYDTIIVTGCGSTHYLSMSAAALIQAQTGISARAVPASEILFHPEMVYSKGQKPLLVTISRSATTTETVQAAQKFRETYGEGVVTISCYDDKDLNQVADLTIAATAGQEKSVAQTRSFSAMVVMSQGFAAVRGGQAVDADVFASDTDFVNNANAFAEPFASPDQYERYFFLGSGTRYGIAAEAMLKMKEMSLTSAEAYHPMEFRHGPMSMVDNKTLIVGLLGNEVYKAEKAVLEDMKQLGGTVVEISPHADADFTIDAGQLVRYLPPVQWMAYHRSINKGLDPDNPRNLSQIIELSSIDTEE